MQIIQSFRAVGEESHARLVRDISLSLNMTDTFCQQFFIKGTVLNFFLAHRVSAKELCSKSLNLLAIRHKCRTEIRCLKFLPRSNSFTYGLLPYRFNILAIRHKCRTEIRWIDLLRSQ